MRHLLTIFRLVGLFLLASVLPAVAAPPTSGQNIAAVAPQGTLTYGVFREGERIGTQTMTFEQMGDELTVRSDTSFDFTRLLVLGFSFIHQAVEVWQNGTLKEFTSFTDEDGNKREVHAQRAGATLLVTTQGQTRELPGSLIPGSLWHPNTIEQHQLLDPIKGRMREVNVQDRGREPVALPGRAVSTHHYALRGGMERDIWYDDGGTVVKVAFQARDGSTITMLLQ